LPAIRMKICTQNQPSKQPYHHNHDGWANPFASIGPTCQNRIAIRAKSIAIHRYPSRRKTTDG